MLWISKAWALALMQRGTRRAAVNRPYGGPAALEQTGADEALCSLVAGHTASIQALLLQMPVLLGEAPETLIELSQQAQHLLPPEERAIRCVNALNIGYGYMALVDLPAARAAFEQTLEEGLAGGNLFAAIYGPINLIVIAMLEGRHADALPLCDAQIQRFTDVLAGQHFPPMGALYILKSSLLLEQDRIGEAEQAVAHGLELVRWTGEFETYMRGYPTKARICAIRGDWPGMLESVTTLEATWPEGARYAQAIRHRLALQYLTPPTVTSTRSWPGWRTRALPSLPCPISPGSIRPAKCPSRRTCAWGTCWPGWHNEARHPMGIGLRSSISSASTPSPASMGWCAGRSSWTSSAPGCITRPAR